MAENTIDQLMAKAQIWLAVLIAMGFLSILAALLYIATHPVPMQGSVVTLLTGLLSVLGTILTLQMNYFYARHRSSAVLDPSPTDNTIQITATSPANAPPAAPTITGDQQT